DGIAAARVAEQCVPAVGAPELAARVHPERGGARPGDHDDAWLALGRTCPGADDIVLEDGWPVIVERANGPLGDRQIQVGVETRPAHADAGDLVQAQASVL